MIKGIGSWLVQHSDRFKNKTAIVYKDKRFTYAEFNERVNRLANGLVELGVRKGDRVDVLMFNTNEMLETMFACAKIGAIFVPINFRLSVDEVEYIVRDSRPYYFIYDGRLRSIVDRLRERATFLTAILQVGTNPHEDDFLYEDLLAKASPEEPSYEIGLDDVHLMMYTSGTTGRPKGALLTHGNTQWNAINAINFMPVQDDEITLTVAPMFHIGGLSVFTTPLLYLGGTVILEDLFHPVETLKIIEREKITSLFLVPAMWQAMTQVPNFDDYDLSSVRFNITGGAPCPITIIEFFQERGIPFFEGFGLTETAPFVSVLDPENSLRKNGSVGKAPIHTEIRIVDPKDKEVPAGEVGELLVKGPNIMRGYWNQPEQTRETIRNGWLYTGDLAKLDEEGFLYIVDRKKDMIISGGENIYPIEVEQVLVRHPNIREVAIIGVPHEKWGETVKAVIVPKNKKESLTIEEIETFCEGKLARFKTPKVVEIVHQLPRNAVGKVLKNVLRKETVQ